MLDRRFSKRGKPRTWLTRHPETPWMRSSWAVPLPDSRPEPNPKALKKSHPLTHWPRPLSQLLPPRKSRKFTNRRKLVLRKLLSQSSPLPPFPLLTKIIRKLIRKIRSRKRNKLSRLLRSPRPPSTLAKSRLLQRLHPLPLP